MRGIDPAMLADRVAPRALSLAGEASKEKRDTNGAAEAEPCLRGIDPALLRFRVAPRALSLVGDASKEKRDSNGVAEAEHL